jgi:tetratricopeptide (TPR) repeat protein
MIRLISLFWCFIMFALPVEASRDSEQTRLFFNGVEYYNNGNYTASIEAFSEISDSGIKNGKLFYNLGNAYMKNNDMGRAVLWYERALKLIPDEPDLRFNLEYTYSLLKDEKGERTSPVLKILFFWKHRLSPFSILWAAIILNILLWSVLTLRIFFKRKIQIMSVLFVILFTLVFNLTAFFNYYETEYVKHGIILAKQIPVRSGLAGNSTELFYLHAGTRVRIEQENHGYFKIYYSKGKIGWVRSAEVGII